MIRVGTIKASRLGLTWAALLCVITAGAAHGQIEPIGPATDYVRFEATAVPDSVRPGYDLKVVLDAYIDAPWKMYALDETLPETNGPRPFGVTTEWALPEGLSVVGVEQSTPKEGLDTNFDLTLLWFYERARFVYTVAVASDLAAGTYGLPGEVRFQICNDDRGICLPLAAIPFEASVVVDPDCLVQEGDVSVECTGDEAELDALLGAVSQPDEEQPSSSSDRPRRGAASGGLFGFFLLAIGAGLATLLTPCVFPMIPLTVSYFTKHADDRPTALRMASVFGLSIVALFTGLGLLMAVLVGAAGAQTIAANPWVNLFIAAVLIAFALSLLGLYELRLPNSLLNYANRQSNERAGYLGVLFMGLTLTLVSFSCTAPFVGGLLAAAAGGTWLFPLVGMIGFSTAFAAPFVLLAIFPNALNRLPSAGGWMNAFKVVLGFVELAAAIKFISNADLVWGWGLLSRPLAIAMTIVIFLVAGTYLLGKLRLPHEPVLETVGVGRLMGAMGFFAISLYMIPGLLGAPLNALDAFLPPRQGTDISLLSQSAMATAGLDDEAWFVDDVDGALAEGRSVGRPVLVDFTGYTCTNCREMEANVFPRQPVQQRFESEFVLLRLYTDGLDLGPDLQRYQLGLTGTVALPTYAIVDADTGRMVTGESGIMSVEEFTEFLDDGVAMWRENRDIAAR
ncbi:MAG: thioredoxin family protein [Rhodothermales bacterium]|nr:thioredoxin family protein [Rhodothermales bacterium]MBO6779488.1 thioredoxin family protein [Rhodothermales bacterium]